MPDIPEEYTEHCPECGKDFDARDLNEVMKHLHTGVEQPKIEGFVSRKVGEPKEWMDGKEELGLN